MKFYVWKDHCVPPMQLGASNESTARCLNAPSAGLAALKFARLDVGSRTGEYKNIAVTLCVRCAETTHVIYQFNVQFAYGYRDDLHGPKHPLVATLYTTVYTG